MAKKKNTRKKNKKKVGQYWVGTYPAMEEEFITDLGDGFYDCLYSFCWHRNRLGVTDMEIGKNEFGQHTITIGVTDGFLSVLPCIPDYIRIECGKRYMATMIALKQQFGDDVDKWPDEVLKDLAQDNKLVLTVICRRVLREKASFSLGVAIQTPSRNYLLRSPMGFAFSDAEHPLIALNWSWSRFELDTHITDFAKEWIVGSDAWQTSRDRRMELFAKFVNTSIEFDEPDWDVMTLSLPRKVWACLFWLFSNEAVDALEEGDIKEKCREIVGSIFTPGKAAAFVLTFDLSTPDNGVEAVLHGPFPFDLLEPVRLRDVLLNPGKEIFRELIPETDIDANSEKPISDNSDRPALIENAVKFGTKILDFLCPLMEENSEDANDGGEEEII